MAGQSSDVIHGGSRWHAPKAGKLVTLVAGFLVAHSTCYPPSSARAANATLKAALDPDPGVVMETFISQALDRLQAQERFLVRQHYTLMVNRYDVTTWLAGDKPGELLATCQQKRMTFREEATFYADKERTQRLFRFKSRKKVDVSGVTDVFAADDQPVGKFRKDFATSLLRSTWYLSQPDLGECQGQERSNMVAVLRRIFTFVPFLDDVPVWLPYHFDFTTADGSPVMTVERKFGSIRDAYRVTIQDPALDRRLAVAMAVALDALQSR
jgi:hypothetical protein